MRVITPDPPRQPVTVEFTADEFEELANLVYRRASGGNYLARDLLRAADDRGLKYRHSRDGGLVA